MKVFDFSNLKVDHAVQNAFNKINFSDFDEDKVFCFGIVVSGEAYAVFCTEKSVHYAANYRLGVDEKGRLGLHLRGAIETLYIETEPHPERPDRATGKQGGIYNYVTIAQAAIGRYYNTLNYAVPGLLEVRHLVNFDEFVTSFERECAEDAKNVGDAFEAYMFDSIGEPWQKNYTERVKGYDWIGEVAGKIVGAELKWTSNATVAGKKRGTGRI